MSLNDMPVVMCMAVSGWTLGCPLRCDDPRKSSSQRSRVHPNDQEFIPTIKSSSRRCCASDCSSDCSVNRATVCRCVCVSLSIVISFFDVFVWSCCVCVLQVSTRLRTVALHFGHSVDSFFLQRGHLTILHLAFTSHSVNFHDIRLFIIMLWGCRVRVLCRLCMPLTFYLFICVLF